MVRNGNPAKQGLKPILAQRNNYYQIQGPKRKSSKTRIETPLGAGCTMAFNSFVRNGNPAKQGLKHSVFSVVYDANFPVVRNGNPAKQGLKRDCSICCFFVEMVSETEIQQNKD